MQITLEEKFSTVTTNNLMKHNLSVMLSTACCLWLMLAGAVRAQEVKLTEALSKITVASAVRVRTDPQVQAQEITRLKLGTIVNVAAHSVDESEIGGKKDYWYRVKLPSGESGWVFGGLLTDYTPARRAEIFRRIIDDRLKAESLSVEDGIDLYNFVSGRLDEATSRNDKGEIELLKLLALGRSVGSIPFDQRDRPPYRDWYRAHQGEIVYSEPSADWLVRSELFWELEKQYRGLPVAERIAWEAAQNRLPGECEGDAVCGFSYLSQTEGRYLSLYPNGSHAGEVLKHFEEALESDDLRSALANKGGDKYVAEAREELKKALAELRTTLSRTTNPGKAAVLKNLDGLSSGYRH